MNYKIGLITYNYPHLKTEQVLLRLLSFNYSLKIFALPFVPKPERFVWFRHRPEQSFAAAPKELASKHQIPYELCLKDTDIDSFCDYYLILGAGVLSSECVKNKNIINCHPRIIPACRGLDAFKWAIYEMKPLGITLHCINEDVDAGEIISIIPTNVYRGDSLTTLARRHYENEIDCLVNFEKYLNHRKNPFANIAKDETKRRMSFEKRDEA